MANRSDTTRKDQVLRYLEQADGWVDGPELANAAVGGSEGLKRVRELRAEGHRIVTRPHPDRARDVFQYRLIPPDRLHPVVQDRLDEIARTPQAAVQQVVPQPTPEPPPLTPFGRPFPMRRNEETGEFELTKEVCVDCGGMYEDDLEHRTTDARHLRWVEGQRKVADQLTIGVPEQPPSYRFVSMPARLDMATATICPRCRGHRRPARSRFDKRRMEMIERPAEDFTRDPYRPTVKGEPNPCIRCNGFGVVPQHVNADDESVQPVRE